MEKSQECVKLTEKLGELRLKLLGDVNLRELQRMQLQIDLLERAVTDELDFHHHDTNEHHDHVTLLDERLQAEKPLGKVRSK